MQGYFLICSDKFFWLKEMSAHPQLGKCWTAAKAVEIGARSGLEMFAKDKLAAVLRNAAQTVPYYQRWFAEKGLDATAPRIEDFPIVEKKDIRGHEEDFVSSSYPRERLSWTRTSGSTGEPFRFAHCREQFDYTYATLWRGMLRFGIRPGDKRVLVKGVDESAAVSLKTRIRRRIYGWLNRCIVVDAHFLAKSEANIAAELKRIIAYRPQYFHGYVSSIYLLAQYAEQHGIDLASLKVKAVVTESEKCYDFQRELMERVFKAPVVENYGCVEFGMIAQPANDGKLCINEDHVYVETTSEGEAVYTNLDEYGFPLIRFKNGDMLKIGSRHPELPYLTIDELDGRKTEMIKLPQGGALQGFIVMHPLYKHSGYLKAYQVYQPDLTHLLIRMSVWREMPEEVQNQIKSEMQTLVGPMVDISMEFREKIPLSKRGKRLFICSDVK